MPYGDLPLLRGLSWKGIALMAASVPDAASGSSSEATPAQHPDTVTPCSLQALCLILLKL